MLAHLAPHYNIEPELFILQLNDETLDPTKSPIQLGLTVVDIIGKDYPLFWQMNCQQGWNGGDD